MSPSLGALLSILAVSGAPIAEVGALAGRVEVQRAGSQSFSQLAFGDVVRAGDRVRTGALGFVRLDFLAHGGLRVGERTAVLLEAGTPERPLVVVEEGVALAFFESAGSGARPLFLRTADGVRVSLVPRPIEPPAQLRITRTTGGAELAGLQGEATVEATGNTRVLRVGQGAELVGGELGQVQPLLPAPAPAPQAGEVRRHCQGTVVRLAWAPVSAAVRYQVQVASDPAFQQLVYSTVTERTSVPFVARSAGRFTWRVAALDRAGRAGELSAAEAVFCEQEPPRDHLAGPEPAATVKFADAKPKISFRWNPAPGARGYRLVVARTPDLLRSAVVNQPATEPGVEVESLGEGKYYWGAYIEDAIPYPLFVQARPLTVQRATKERVRATRTLKDWGK